MVSFLLNQPIIFFHNSVCLKPFLMPDVIFEYLHDREFSRSGSKPLLTEEEEESFIRTVLAETDGGRDLSFSILKKMMTREIRKIQTEQPERKLNTVTMDQSGHLDVDNSLVQRFIGRNECLKQFLGNGERFSCDVCGRSFRVKGVFQKHMSNKHSEVI